MVEVRCRVSGNTTSTYSYEVHVPGADVILVLAVAGAAAVLFITEKLRVDVAALAILVALVALRVISPGQALYGFANPATATVACMFILSAGLARTGLVEWLARQLDKLAGKGETRLLLVLALAIACVSAFVVNTATVAIFIPVAMALARRRKVAGSRILMPLSFASQFGGVCTLIGTSTNILVSSIAVAGGLSAFGLFEFARLGLVMSVVGIAYLAVVGKWLLPRRRGEDQQIDKYRLSDYLAEFRVAENSPIIGKTWRETEAGGKGETELIKLIRKDEATWRPRTTVMRAGDVLLVHGDADKLIHIKDNYRLETKADEKINDRNLSSDDIKLVETLVPPRSRFIGRTIARSDIQRRFGCIILGVQRRGRVLRTRLAGIRLDASDTLLLQCDTDSVQRLLRSRDLVVTNELTELYLRRNRAVVALVILGGILALAALGIVPILLAVMLGAVAMVITGCLTIDQAYQAIDWKIIFLLGGLLPLGLALEASGAASWLTAGLLGPAMSAGPLAVLAILYITTAVLTEAMSNNAAAVLLAPIAFSVARTMNVDPRPFLVAITFAASTSFATPVGYQTNTMVYAPGGYRFTDFAKLGIPLNLLFWGVAVLLIPRFWPF
jgi:di/tricarboxylate transporter